MTWCHGGGITRFWNLQSESPFIFFENSSILDDHFQQNDTGFQLQQLSFAASVRKTDDLTPQPRQPGSNLVYETKSNWIGIYGLTMVFSSHTTGFLHTGRVAPKLQGFLRNFSSILPYYRLLVQGTISSCHTTNFSNHSTSGNTQCFDRIYSSHSMTNIETRWYQCSGSSLCNIVF